MSVNHLVASRWVIELPPPRSKGVDNLRWFLFVQSDCSWGPRHTFTWHVNEAYTFSDFEEAHRYLSHGTRNGDIEKGSQVVSLTVTYALAKTNWNGK